VSSSVVVRTRLLYGASGE